MVSYLQEWLDLTVEFLTVEFQVLEVLKVLEVSQVVTLLKVVTLLRCQVSGAGGQAAPGVKCSAVDPNGDSTHFERKEVWDRRHHLRRCW